MPAISGRRASTARDVRRLTTADGDEQNPVFSPDGTRIAFSANYDGNTDVYIIPTTGGTPKRLTWHPDADIVQGFTPDGKNVLFTSGRSSYTNRYTQLFTVSIDGGAETKLPIPNAARASYLARRKADRVQSDLERLRRMEALPRRRARRRSGCMTSPPTRSRKFRSPRGAATTSTHSGSATRSTSAAIATESSISTPTTPARRRVKRLTTHKDFPVLNLSVGAGKIIYEQAGYLHLLDPSTSGNARLAIGVAADCAKLGTLREGRSLRAKCRALAHRRARRVRVRGEIVTVPVEKGDARNLTNTTGANERSPAWSADGSQIAYISDASGEYELKIEPQDGRGTTKTLKLMGHGFYQDLDWSPDGTHIAYADNSMSTYVIDVKTGIAKLDGKQQGVRRFRGPT